MSAGRHPRVAVLIPCFEQRRFLAAAIDSVIGQTMPAAEIIVVDDGSSEDLASVTSQFENVRLIRQDNRGLSGARNTGFKAATSEKVIFLDADDRLLPDAVKLGLKAFKSQPDAGFVYGAIRVAQGNSQWPRFTPASSHLDLIRCNWIACPAAAMFDRLKLLKVGGFDESLGMCEDWDAFLRLARQYPLFAYDEPVAIYFKHDANMSNDEDSLMRWVEVVRRREKERGLTGEQLAAWDEGEKIWRSFYGPPPSFAARLVSALARRIRII